ncbi:MAG TPA: CaiB/BaiF CoA-transferase family protein [Gammaproteobacteria bacterium]|jgi:crotonobetainyl-CoA:carnitine CoA-transferase CaiB-like acyl-CoA transferase|nr:CoA transferase [Gammaproteobacteria bacterium]MDP7152867.1 CaiB/BaiF CoA-transferase family protein [Gammaproteobacteria bacterium]HJP38677.1 CaiB/BaiF CoA-transferase family protein [Gammaproteobacteria bacterium]
MNGPDARPLDGFRIIEVGQLLAGPFVGCILGYFGAEVIKIESPGDGDPIRKWRVLDDSGTSWWWHSLGRNKKCVTANLRSEQGQAIVRQLIEKADAVVENFRPGRMEKWDLGPDAFKTSNPGLIYARISGYGQDGPYASKPGFASVCEGVGGLRYVNGFPDGPPVRPNLSLGDTLAGLHTALGIVMALVQRLKDPDGSGQIIDTALFESVFNMLEGVVPEFDGAGIVREPSGSTLTGIVPTNTYRCTDGKFIIIGANGDSIFKRLCDKMGRPEMGTDPRFANNAGRVEHEAEIDAAITQWTCSLDSATALTLLEEAHVPSGPIYNVADMLADEHFNARGLFEEVEVNGKPLKIPGMAPKFSRTPGRTDWPGPAVGAFNDEILGGLLGISAADQAKLKDDGII